MRRALLQTLTVAVGLAACLDHSLPPIAPATDIGGTTTAGGATVDSTPTTGGSTTTGGSNTTTTGGTSTGGSTTAGNGNTPTLIDDFANGTNIAPGWGVWSTSGGGANQDETHAISYTAPGLTNNAAELTYTSDSGAYSYSQLTLSFDANRTLQGYTDINFRLQGTGNAPVYIMLVTSLSNPNNDFATYGALIGAAPTTWTLYSTHTAAFTAVGNANFTLQQALDPNNLQGLRFDVAKSAPAGTAQSGSLDVDDLSVQ